MKGSMNLSASEVSWIKVVPSTGNDLIAPEGYYLILDAIDSASTRILGAANIDINAATNLFPADLAFAGLPFTEMWMAFVNSRFSQDNLRTGKTEIDPTLTIEYVRVVRFFDVNKADLKDQ